jgi:hypothetical protein
MCKGCGFPLRFARYFDWRSDGTIIGTDRVKIQSRITFLERGELEGLFDDLSMMLGISIDNILIEAEKNIGKAFYASTPLRFLRFAPRNPRMRPSWVAITAVKGVKTDVAGLGSGVIRAESYSGGDSMVLRIANPVFVPRTVGNSLGIYESIERIHGADCEYGIEDGDLVIRMSHPSCGSRPDTLSETRLVLDEIVPVEGPVEYRRCLTCGTPLLASMALEWDLSAGTITNRLTGKRELVGAVQSVNAMMRELEAELGEDVLTPLYQCQKEITRTCLDRDDFDRGDDFWERFLILGAIRGLGYPSHLEVDDSGVDVEIANAYNPILYAARVAAGLEYVSGEFSAVEWSDRDATSCAFRVSTQR